jgi:hypothetical protein
MRAIVEVRSKASKGVSPNYDGLYYLLTHICDRRTEMKFATIVSFDGLISGYGEQAEDGLRPRQVEVGSSAYCISVNIKESHCSESRLSPCDNKCGSGSLSDADSAKPEPHGSIGSKRITAFQIDTTWSTHRV